MKKVVFSLTLSLFTAFVSAQIAIGKESIDGDAIWDFSSVNNQKGIVLPYTVAIPAPVSGTLTFDRADQKVKYYSNGAWVEMTAAGLPPSYINTSPENTTNGMVVGDTSTEIGVLVLESSNKALVLPKVSNASLDIFNPSPGTICYDLSAEAIAIFNGSNWSYWK
jgi:hypothetical protein